MLTRNFYEYRLQYIYIFFLYHISLKGLTFIFVLIRQKIYFRRVTDFHFSNWRQIKFTLYDFKHFIQSATHDKISLHP